jgi:hypothetical protein
MVTSSKPFLTAWHAAVLARDVTRLNDWIVEDAVISSPAFWKPKGPKAYVMKILKSVFSAFEDMTYDRDWIDGQELCLEFSARIGDIRLRGIDRISLNEHGRMSKIEVFIRPGNALMALAAHVKQDIAPTA